MKKLKDKSIIIYRVPFNCSKR